MRGCPGAQTHASNAYDGYKAFLVEGAQFSEHYEFPVLGCRSASVPKRMLPFDKAMRAADHDCWLHFFIQDQRFECVWNNPRRYLPVFQRFEGVISPDFSIYREMPLAMQLWNTYRNRAIACWLERNGVSVIPNVRWGDERSYDFAFEGLPRGGIVAVSTNGCIRSRLDRFYFCKGLDRMLDALTPKTVINYSQTPGDIFDVCRARGATVVPIEHHAIAVRKGMV